MPTKEVILRISSGGRIVLPREFRQLLGIETGDDLIATLQNSEIKLITRKEGIRRAQQIIGTQIPAGTMLSDEIIEDRTNEKDIEPTISVELIR